jgi:hypothetical protein
MKRALIPLLLAGTLCVAALNAAKPSPPRAAVTTFSGAGGLAGDGAGPYVHAVDCVTSTYQLPSGDYSFRTASHTVGSCEQNQGPWPRQITLDLSNQAIASALVNCAQTTVPAGLSLDVCGPNDVRDGRIAVAGLFGSASNASVSVYLTERPDLNDTEFVLTYQQPLAIAPSGAGRTLTSVGTGRADLYRAVKQLNKKGAVIGYSLEWLGVWDVPTTLTVTPAP